MSNHICTIELTTAADCIRLLLHLHESRICYTPDDDFGDIVDNNDQPTFTPTVARLYNQRMAEAIELTDGETFDAYGIGLELNFGCKYTLMDGGKILTWGKDRPTCINGVDINDYTGHISFIDTVIINSNINS